MFDNIGSKIKSLAQIVCWLGIIVSAVSGLAIMISNEETVFVGLLIILLGSIGSWIGSFVLYGFGQLIENSDTLVEISKHSISKAPKESSVPTSPNTDTTDNGSDDNDIHCPHCDRKIMVPEGTLSANCPWCNKKISFM